MALAEVSEQLAAVLQNRLDQGVSDASLHEAKRLLLNQLKASAEAAGQPMGRLLQDWALAAQVGRSRVKGAPLLWSAGRATADHAAAANGMLCDLLDYGDTDLATGLRIGARVVPAVLAHGEVGGHSGLAVLGALALGIETELAWASLRAVDEAASNTTPRAWGVSGIGAAAACGVLAGLDVQRMGHALRLAIGTSAHAAPVPTTFFMAALPHVAGMSAQAGYTACTLARHGLEAPLSAFDPDPSDGTSEDSVFGELAARAIDGLRQAERLFDIAHHTWPAPVIAQAPIEAALNARLLARERTPVRMRLALAPEAWHNVQARHRHTNGPDQETGTAPDLRFCVAAAWARGQFSADELQATSSQDPGILALRSCVELAPDAGSTGIAACTLDLQYSDGSTESVEVEHFLGSPGRPLSDSQLSELFRSAAEDLVLPTRAGQILQALWGLHAASDIRSLTALLRPPR